MKTKVRLNKPFKFKDIAFDEGTIGVVEKYVSADDLDYAIVILENKIAFVPIADIDFVEFFKPVVRL